MEVSLESDKLEVSQEQAVEMKLMCSAE